MSVGMILPGATIGFLGGGQLGRMAGMAARSLGYDVHVLDPDPNCPARAVASRTITARFDDADAAADLARRCDVVTLEIEQIAPESMERIRGFAPVRPGGAVLDRVRDRADQKQWLSGCGFPVGPFRVVRSEAELREAVAALGPSVAKTTRGGYDGRGQVRLSGESDVQAAWAALAGRPCVVEQFLELSYEISVLVARRPGGEARAFPPSLNHHERGVLTWSVTPAPIPSEMASRATQLAAAITRALDVEGLLAVEMFVRGDGELLVNELAPRPHNT
ncbi:MAG TPA: ATP-grasp domain-containing protein, partial [Gemmatimonadaceae bacterium]|nr:ATP-grasp domain-containing protein [Gemmatimonadaceae bacterium]